MDPEEIYFEDEWNHYNVTESYYDEGLMTTSSTGLIVHIVIHCVVFVIGVPGNVLVLLIFSRCHIEAPFNMSSNSPILSLAAADLGILLFYVPFYVVYEFKHLVWPFGSAMCKLVFSSTHICIYASLGTMVSVAIERYLVTFHLHVSRQKVVMAMLAVWIVALLLSIPQMINLQLVPLEDYGDHDPKYACELVWPNQWFEKILHPVDFAMFYLLPVGLTSILYGKITSMLRSAIRQNLLNRQLTKQVKKVVHVLIVVVIVFAICNFPIYIFHLYRVFQFNQWLQMVDKSPWIFSLFAALYLIPHTVNPLVYAVLDRKFRKEVFNILIKCKPLCFSLPWKRWKLSCREKNENESTDRRHHLLRSQERCPYQVEAQRLSQCTKL